MGRKIDMALLAMTIVCLPVMVNAENWLEFHHEKWNHKSGKVKKKLIFSNSYYYDSDSIVRTSSGNVTVWVKEVADNDRFYVKKGNPKSEIIFRKVHFWCKLNKYETIQADEEDGGLNELMGEEIRSGSYYEKLYDTLCIKK